MCNILSNAWPTFSCSNTRVVHNGRHVARILQGGGTEAAKVHFFSKKLTTFFSCRHQNLKGSIFLAYLRPAECNTENNVTLLNKAGHKSQQSQFFPVIIHPIDDQGGTAPFLLATPLHKGRLRQDCYLSVVVVVVVERTDQRGISYSSFQDTVHKLQGEKLD